MPLDRSKLVKMLALTESENDNEALSAIRMANRLLRESGVRWTGLITGSRERIKVAGEAPDWVEEEPEVSLREAFEILESRGELIDDYKVWYGWFAKFGKLDPSKVRVVYQRLKETGDV